MSGNLYNQITATVQRRSAAMFLETDSGEQLTYAEFDAWTARYAAWLAAKGVRPGDRVLVQADKSAHVLLLCYACIRAGAVFVPINVGSRRPEIASVLQDAEPALVIADPRRERLYDELRASAPSPFQLATLAPQGRGTASAEAGEFEAAPTVARVPPDAPAALMYTSGTTGRPKAAIITHQNILSNGQALRTFWEWSENEVLLHPLPLHHLHGLFVATMPSLLAGAKILLQRRFSAPAALAVFHRVTVFMGVPTYFTRLLPSPLLTSQCCANLRLFISGSAPLPGQTAEAFQQRTGREILERYGMTETGGVACNPPHQPRRLGRVGIPLPGFSLRIENDGDRASAAEQVGELQVKGPSVFSGYWRRPEETAAAFTEDDYFRTGDLARKFPDGSFEIVGRAKDVIITGGANVNPLEVESVIDGYPGVAESAVIGVPHPDYGEAVVAIVIRQELIGAQASNDSIINGLYSRLKRELALYKVPRKIVFRSELPRNAMGKVQKNVLRSDPVLLAQLR